MLYFLLHEKKCIDKLKLIHRSYNSRLNFKTSAGWLPFNYVGLICLTKLKTIKVSCHGMDESNRVVCHPYIIVCVT